MNPADESPRTRRWSHRTWVMPLVVLAVAWVLKLTLDTEKRQRPTPSERGAPVEAPTPEPRREPSLGGMDAPTLGRVDAIQSRLRLHLSSPLPRLPEVGSYALLLRRPETDSRPPRALVRLAPGDAEALLEDLRPGPYEIFLRAEAAPGLQGQAELQLGAIELAASEEELTLELSAATLRQAVADHIRPR